jgi:superfamily II DNA/RNA helicase
VYVWLQEDAEAVGEYLNEAGVIGEVVIYHGGMNCAARAKSQSRFMRGKARVCVATIAFGLGIDKADVDGVSICFDTHDYAATHHVDPIFYRGLFAGHSFVFVKFTGTLLARDR